MIVDFDSRALLDLDRIQSQIARENPAAAERIYERLGAACRGPAIFPLRGRASQRSGLRELTTVHPYIVIYDVRSDVVRIRRIVHGARLR